MSNRTRAGNPFTKSWPSSNGVEVSLGARVHVEGKLGTVRGRFTAIRYGERTPMVRVKIGSKFIHVPSKVVVIANETKRPRARRRGEPLRVNDRRTRVAK